MDTSAMTTTTLTPQDIKKQEILDQAQRLFYGGGFHATGVDTVLADTGISKRTLYKYFPSKEHLIEAVLDRYGRGIDDALFAPVYARTSDPRARIDAVFDIRREMMDMHDCRGCLAMKAAQEYKDKHAGIEAAGRRSVTYIEGKLIELCRAAGIADPEEKGRMVAMLLQGTILTSQLRGDTVAFDTAKRAVAVLLA